MREIPQLGFLALDPQLQKSIYHDLKIEINWEALRWQLFQTVASWANRTITSEVFFLYHLLYSWVWKLENTAAEMKQQFISCVFLCVSLYNRKVDIFCRAHTRNKQLSRPQNLLQLGSCWGREQLSKRSSMCSYKCCLTTLEYEFCFLLYSIILLISHHV